MKNTPPILLWAYWIGALLIPATFISDIWLDIDYERLANIALAVAAVLVTAFTTLYGFRSKWWTNLIGAPYLVKCVAMSAFLLQAAASVWIEWWAAEFAFRQQIRFVIYTFPALIYVPMIIILVREQQNDRREAREVTGKSFPP
ncbi:hypothetical protein EV580_1289 [Mycobacterium sp. BK086]|uniref:putative phage holin n=1 Tax=Mycobacterium sp. BK086 TaxID=2512165 RepID=UPI0010E5C3C5|nr:hypothetical protein [Mycobacterium sp. BK086]TDO18108.1 hypothetical protein EV580_1289 [Mycobacterium sp. BK086]